MKLTADLVPMSGEMIKRENVKALCICKLRDHFALFPKYSLLRNIELTTVHNGKTSQHQSNCSIRVSKELKGVTDRAITRKRPVSETTHNSIL